MAVVNEQMRENMEVRFKEPDLYEKLLNRIVCDDVLIDHELISRNFLEGKGAVEMLCIYHTENGQITKGHFKMFNKQVLG